MPLKILSRVKRGLKAALDEAPLPPPPLPPPPPVAPVVVAPEPEPEPEPEHDGPATLDDAGNLVEYWEVYARDWKASSDAPTLGKEWHNEQGYLDHLKAAVGALEDQFSALELGAGGGRISNEFLRCAGDRFGELVLADSSRSMLEHCRKNVGERPRVRLEQLNGIDLHQFADSHFHFVYSHDVFVHFEDIDIFNYLREVFRVLRPGGSFLVSVNDPVENFAYFLDVANHFRTILPEDRVSNRVRFIPESMMRRFAEEIGFQPPKSTFEKFAIYQLKKKR